MYQIRDPEKILLEVKTSYKDSRKESLEINGDDVGSGLIIVRFIALGADEIIIME